MCGICGIFSKSEEPPSSDMVRKMAKILSHRGPDDGNITDVGKACLGHRRLAIIDPAKGQQPLQSSDNRYTLSYNGEIYNHEEIRKELIELGYEFKTRCDTEVVLNSFIEWQEECLKKFNGMFAFAVYDKHEKRLFLARDRAGQKPLYYAECGNDFIFSSEITGLKLHPDFNSGIDMTSLHLYISHMYVPGPDTIYACAKELSPAHYAFISEAGIKIVRYWHPDYKNKTELSYDEAKKKLRALIMFSTEKRLMSDVPLGAFLSGGLDSSITVAAMSEASSSSLRTFTIGSHDNRYNEIGFANTVAN
ncbi:MAG: asparagine synthase (glutamine-hydrolyzing), partial [Planctomycetota bacterium]